MAQTSERHHHESQLGSTAVAHPVGLDGLPPAAPALHHLGDDHTFESQVGPSAIAPPNGLAAHPDQLPEQHHLDNDQPSAKHPVKPFNHTNEPSNQPPLSSAPDPNDKHTTQSQLGASAIAAPSGIETLPTPAPALHHIRDEHTHETQLGQPAIAPPAELYSNPWQDEDGDQQEGEEEENTSNLTFPSLPPFPKDIPTAPLTRISLLKLLQINPREQAKLLTASQELGFFYLDLRAATSPSSDISGSALERDIDALFTLGENLFSLPTSEKQKYDFAAQGSYFGYKGLGAGVLDAQGTRDRNEFYNVSKDDVLGISQPALPAPECLRGEEARGLLAGYVRKCHAIVTLLLGVLNDRLGYPEGTLQGLHRLGERSGDQVRWVKSPPSEQPEDEGRRALGEHTDFGTLTLLSNRLGGLQILPPATPSTPQPKWQYIHPLPNHLIVNLGDALVRFTSSVLRSNLHRVVSPPGEQGKCERMSLVYFARPEDEVEMRVVGGSGVVDSAVAEKKEEGGEKGKGEGEGEKGGDGKGGGQEGEEKVETAKEWILRRALGRRVGGDFGGSEGTEGGRV